jgi:hypothetical protein
MASFLALFNFLILDLWATLESQPCDTYFFQQHKKADRGDAIPPGFDAECFSEGKLLENAL